MSDLNRQTRNAELDTGRSNTAMLAGAYLFLVRLRLDVWLLGSQQLAEQQHAFLSH